MVRICIKDTDRGKLKICLKITRIIGDTWSINSIELVILMLAKPDFVLSRIDLMTDDNSKVKILHVYKDNIFSFMYDVKNTIPDEFIYYGLYDGSNFEPKTKVAIKL